jgi:simple sugar transport system permease protein
VLQRQGRSRSAAAISLVREAALLPVLVVLIVVGTLLKGGTFLSVNNISGIGQQISALGVITVGESLILLIAGMDLSLESTYGLAPMVGAWLLVPVASFGNGTDLNPYLGILIVFAVGAVVGIVNGLLIVKGRLNGFIVTLGMTILLAGIQDGIVKGQSPFNLPGPFGYLGSAYVGKVPVSLIVAAVVFAVVGLFLRYHRTGRAIYAIGGNREAARAAGIKVDRIKIGVYVAGSVLAALGGLMEAGRVSSVTGSQGYGEGIIFSVFAAAVIGGVSLQGGRGNMVGAASGVILLGLVQNILDLMNAPNYWIDAIDGAVILFALILARVIGGEATAELCPLTTGEHGPTGEHGRTDEHDPRIRHLRRPLPYVPAARWLRRHEPQPGLLGGLRRPPDRRAGRPRRAGRTRRGGPGRARVRVHDRARQRRAARGDPCAGAAGRRAGRGRDPGRPGRAVPAPGVGQPAALAGPRMRRGPHGHRRGGQRVLGHGRAPGR